MLDYRLKTLEFGGNAETRMKKLEAGCHDAKHWQCELERSKRKERRRIYQPRFNVNSRSRAHHTDTPA